MFVGRYWFRSYDQRSSDPFSDFPNRVSRFHYRSRSKMGVKAKTSLRLFSSSLHLLTVDNFNPDTIFRGIFTILSRTRSAPKITERRGISWPPSWLLLITCADYTLAKFPIYLSSIKIRH